MYSLLGNRICTVTEKVVRVVNVDAGAIALQDSVAQNGAANQERTLEDQTSGAKAPRPGLTEALAFTRPGDTLASDGLASFLH